LKLWHGVRSSAHRPIGISKDLLRRFSSQSLNTRRATKARFRPPANRMAKLTRVTQSAAPIDRGPLAE
jgi:hypothetical protein